MEDVVRNVPGKPMGVLRNLFARLMPSLFPVALTEDTPEVLRIACENVDEVEATLRRMDENRRRHPDLPGNSVMHPLRLTTEVRVARRIDDLIRDPMWGRPEEKPDTQDDIQFDERYIGMRELPDGRIRYLYMQSESSDDRRLLPPDSPRHPEWTTDDMEVVRLATQREWNRRHPDATVFEWCVGMEVEGLGRVDEETNSFDNTKNGIVVLVSGEEGNSVRREVDRAFGEDIHGEAYLRRRLPVAAGLLIDALERKMGIEGAPSTEDKAGHESQPVAWSEEDRLKVSHDIDDLVWRPCSHWGEYLRIETQKEWNRRHPDAEILVWGYGATSPDKLGVQRTTTDYIVLLETDGEFRERMYERATGRDVTDTVHHIDFQWRKCLMATEDAYRTIWEAHQDEIPFEGYEDKDRFFRHVSKRRIEDMHRIRETISRVEDGTILLMEDEKRTLDEAKATLDEIWEEAGPMWTKLTMRDGGRIPHDYSKVDKHSPEYLMSQGFYRHLHDYSYGIGLQFIIESFFVDYDGEREKQGNPSWFQPKYNPYDHWLDGTIEEDVVTGEAVKFDMAYCW